MMALTEEAIQHEIDEISAIVADMNYEEENSWIAQLDLNNTNNQSANNDSLDVSATVLKELDENTKDSWLFPVEGFEKRDYQFNISRSTLFNNTLVILPTGLGKTFISSVTMYNFTRWFPQSKIVFMAPTRPLVTQQIDACFNVVGIPKTQTAEMTGKAAKKKRKEEWETKRVFFATPQVVLSDIKDGIFPCKAIKLLVFDEAHKAKGDYAYCKVIEEMLRVNKNFRVLGLTATAGKTADVIQIIQNLLISKIEIRSEASIDVQRYTHKKQIEIVPVKLSSDIQEIYDYFIKVIDPIIKDLRNANAINTNQISKGYLIIQKKKLLDNLTIPNQQKSQISTNFSAAIGFYHSLEILQRHSVHLFLKSLRDDENKTHFKFFIARDFRLTKYVKDLEAKYEPVSPLQINVNPLPNGKIPAFPADKQIDFGHPKFDILKSKLKTYFDNTGTKAIIFCEYRDTTQLIYTLLLQLRPQVIGQVLIGQGGIMNQKAQLQIMKSFREGKINVLICTCVAEEGLDVGEVDLVICFDINTKNAVRFVQRIGRTARKRAGQVIVLATEGKELSMSRELLSSKDQMNNSVTKNKDIAKYLYKGVKLFPPKFDPKCIEMKFVIPNEQEPENEKPKNKRATKNQAKKNLVEPSSSREAITNYLRPVSRKPAAVPDIIDDELVILDSETPADKRDYNFNEILDGYKSKIQQFLEKDEIKGRNCIKAIIQDHSKKEIAKAMSFLLMLEAPITEDPKFKLEEDEFEFLPIPVEKPNFSNHSNQFENEFEEPEPNICNSPPSVHYYRKFENFDSPLPPNFSGLKNSSTPIRSVLSPRNNFSFQTTKNTTPNLAASTSRCDAENLLKMEQSLLNHSKKHTSENKFGFLGIMSIEDIFEGCDSKIDYSKLTDNIQKSFTEDVIECSIEEEPKESQVLKNLNLNDINDLFDSSTDKSPKEIERNILINEDEEDRFSDQTQIYDVEEEIAKIEESRKESSDWPKNDENQIDLTGFSSQKENIQHNREDSSFLKKTTSKPNLMKLMTSIQSSSTFLTGNTQSKPDVSIYQNTEDIETQILEERCATPTSQEITIRSNESTPEILNKTAESNVNDTFVSPVTTRFARPQNVKRRIATRRKKLPHSSFLQTQAAVDGAESSDELEDHDDSIHEFVCNDTNVFDHTNMHAKYVKSLQSPSAPRNNRFILRQLQPANFSDIYSQFPHDDEEEMDADSDMDSFIVDGDEEVASEESELDELEIAERRIKDQKRKRKAQANGRGKSAKKRKVVVAHSESSDEDEALRKLREEVLRNAD